MGRGIQGAILTAMGARLHTASVTATSWITPHVRAVDFHCPGLLDGQERPGAVGRVLRVAPSQHALAPGTDQRGAAVAGEEAVAVAYGVVRQTGRVVQSARVEALMLVLCRSRLLCEERATARHAIHGVQWRWLDRPGLGHEGPF